MVNRESDAGLAGTPQEETAYTKLVRRGTALCSRAQALTLSITCLFTLTRLKVLEAAAANIHQSRV